jgi:membrane associated rhomboid family serine protease
MVSASVGFQCPECVSAAPQKVLRPADLASNDMLVKVIVGINALIFLLTSSASNIRVDFGLIARARNGAEIIGVAEGEVWRLVTSGFLHANLMHVGFNMYLLWMLGRAMERMLGWSRLGLLYMVSMLGGSFGALLLSPEALTIGASGAVFGLMGAMVMMQMAAGMNPMDGGIGGLVLMNLFITFLIPNISIGGHLGGLVAGAAVGWLFSELGKKQSKMSLAVGLTAGLGVALFGASLWIASNPIV